MVGDHLVFVDCEGHGPAAGLNDSTAFEFGAVAFKSRATFHGTGATAETFTAFDRWLTENVQGQPVFVSDNPAYDWQFVNAYFWQFLKRNPFGHSARRIGDFYAGLVGNFSETQRWKRLRQTPHDHNPVHDALGNVEAFERLLKGDR